MLQIYRCRMAKTKAKGKVIVDSDDSSNEEEIFSPSKANEPKGSTSTGGSAYEKVKAKWMAEDCYALACSAGGHNCPSISAHTLSTCAPGPAVFEWLLKAGVLTSDGGSAILPLLLRTNDGRQVTVNPLEASVIEQSASVSKSGFDLFINAGGPVWASSVCPQHIAESTEQQSVFDVLPVDKYIAIGVSAMGSSTNGNDKARVLGEPEKGDNLLQIWHVHGWMRPPAKAAADRKIRLAEKKNKAPATPDPNQVAKPKGRPRKYPRSEKDEQRDRRRQAKAAACAAAVAAEGGDSEMDVESGQDGEEGGDAKAGRAASGWDVDAALVYCVSLPARGPTWAAEWSPSPISTPSSGSGAGGASVLGILALVNGDGTCTVLQLPKITSTGSGRDPGGVSVFSEEAVCVAVVAVPGAMICSVAWSATGRQFSCGMSDGSVTVWSMDQISAASWSESRAAVSLSRPLMHLVDTQQAESQIACMAAVRAVQYCPYDASLLLAAGQDDIKIWSLRDTSAPAFSKKAAAPAVSACWDATGFGYYTGDCECTSLQWNPLWGATLPTIHRRELYAHALTYGAIWGARSVRNDDQSFVLTAASDGTVRGGYTSIMTSVKNKNTSAVEYCKVLSVRRDTVNESVPMAQSSGSGGSSSRTVGREALVIELEDGPRLLPTGAGVDGLNENNAVAWQSLDLVSLTDPAAISVAGAGEKGARTPAKGKAGKAQAAQAQRASLALAVYGGATGLVRVQCLDPLRELHCSPATPS